MSRSLVNKIKLLLILALVVTTCGFAGYFALAKAQSIISVTDVTTFQMEGAGLFHNDEKQGLEFNASISSEEYEGLRLLGKVNTGLIIAPYEYHESLPLTIENLFGATAKYDWAEYDYSLDNPDYVYGGNNSTSTKVRVININENDWLFDGERYIYSGAIVDVLSSNVERTFASVCYLEVNGEYIITDVYKSSIPDEIRKLDTIPDWVPSAWVDASAYTVKFNLSSMVGSNVVICTYNGQDSIADTRVQIGKTLSELVSAKPHLKYSDEYMFDRWVYEDPDGKLHTITLSTKFTHEIFKEGTVTIVAQSKRTPYGPTIQ